MSTRPVPPDVSRILVGGYTAEAGGTAVGISTWHRTRAEPEEWTLAGTVPLPSPTWLVRHPDRPLVFAVSETAPSRVSSFAEQRDGTLVALGSTSLGGEGGCHLAVAPDRVHLVIAHYGSGDVSTVAVDAEGFLSEELDLLQLSGSGPDPERQAGAHAHQVVVLGDELLVADLGTDSVHRLRVDEYGRLSVAAPPLELPPGTGPRHLVVLGDHLAVAGELSAELWLGRRTGPGWQQVDLVPTSSARNQEVAPSGLVADGRRLFVANRGVGTVGVFDVDAAADRLVPVAEIDCGGSWPRDLTVSEGRLWVALQTEDRVAMLRTGLLPAAPTDLVLETPSPACVLLATDGEGDPGAGGAADLPTGSGPAIA